MPVENAAGTRPIQADSAVISMGRMRFSAARSMASTGPNPCALNWLKKVSTRMPFMTDTPNSDMNPMAAETLNGNPVTNKASMPPPGDPLRRHGGALPGPRRRLVESQDRTLLARQWRPGIPWRSPELTEPPGALRARDGWRRSRSITPGRGGIRFSMNEGFEVWVPRTRPSSASRTIRRRPR
jgi:hypothetical protein